MKGLALITAVISKLGPSIIFLGFLFCFLIYWKHIQEQACSLLGVLEN